MLNKPYALVPIGEYFNVGLQQAANGADLVFMGLRDWVRHDYVLLRKSKIAVNTQAFTFLVKSLYGNGANVDVFWRYWENVCLDRGIDADTMNRSRVLLIEVKQKLPTEPHGLIGRREKTKYPS